MARTLKEVDALWADGKYGLLISKINALLCSGFSFGMGISFGASELTGQAIADFFSESSESEASLDRENGNVGMEIGVGAVEIAEIAGMEMLLVLFAVGVSSVSVLRMKPKDILSKMS